MRQALVIARRELVEKRFVTLAAAAFAVVPFLLGAIPWIRGGSTTSELIATAAGMLAVGFTGGLAVILGSSVIGRDLAENRLSFYFSRPLGAASIWFGKVTAALALIVATFVIIVVPARLGAASGWRHSWGGQDTVSLVLIVLGGAVTLFFAAHVVGSFVRSRSAWIAIDFLALLMAAFATYLIIFPLVWHGAELALKALGGIIAAGVIVALIGGGAWQLERGRTDRRRSHVALSQFTWISIGAGLLMAGALLAWMASASPRDLKKNGFVDIPRSGSWVLMGGEARGRLDYPTAFLYNADTGNYSRLPFGRLWNTSFTRDGKTLFVWRADARRGQAELFRRALDSGEEVSTGLTTPLLGHAVATENGDRVASVYGSLLSVYDVTRRQSLGSVRLPVEQNTVVAMYFPSPATLHLVTFGAGTLRLFEFDVARRALQQTGALQMNARGVGIAANEDGSRLLVRDYQPSTSGLRSGVSVIDGRTGALLYRVSTGDPHAATLLRDGGVAVSRMSDRGVALDFIDASGTVVRSVVLPVSRIGPIGVLRDGSLAVPTYTEKSPRETVVIDPGTGTIVRRIPGAALLGYALASWRDLDPRRSPIDLPRIYVSPKDELVRWNPSTNSTEPLLR